MMTLGSETECNCLPFASIFIVKQDADGCEVGFLTTVTAVMASIWETESSIGAGKVTLASVELSFT
ncbi:hypothetical protein DsansV1_C35g0231351 [Dioscorea sansibarensis]